MSTGHSATDFRRALPLLPGSGPYLVVHAEEGPRDDPFAPPPQGTPDRPWQPRHQPPGPAAGTPTATEDAPPGRQEPRDGTVRPQVPPPHPWSPGWQDGHAGRTAGPGQGGPRQGPRGPFPPPTPGPQQRWDPTDPAQRHARYALLSGMWGIFFFILGVPYVTLLLAALALYWSVSALRGAPRAASAQGPGQGAATASGPAQRPAAAKPQAPAAGWGGPPQYGAQPVRPQTPAALGGLLAALVGLCMVAANFAVHLAYKPYFDCVHDALTTQSRAACTDLLPEQLRGYFAQSASS